LKDESPGVLPALIVGVYPHLGSGLDDDSDKKPLPRKADESKLVLSRKPESTEGITSLLRQKIRLGDSTTAPSATFKYKTYKMAQSKSTTSTKLRIRTINKMASTHGTIRDGTTETLKQNKIMAGSLTYLGPTGVPEPIPESR